MQLTGSSQCCQLQVRMPRGELEIQANEIILEGKLTPTNRLTEATYKAAQAKQLW